MSTERSDLRVNMTGNKTGFDAMLSAARREAKGFAEEISKGFSVGSIMSGTLGGFVGMASFQGFKDLMTGVFDRVRDIRETAEQFDLSTDSVQKWEKAMGKAGVTSQQFYRSLDFLRNKAAEARQEQGKRGDFDRLGIGLSQLAPGNEEALLKQILSSGATRPEINALLGRGGARLQSAMQFYANAKPSISESQVEQMFAIQAQSAQGKAFFRRWFLDAPIIGWTSVLTSDFWSDMGTLATGGVGALAAKRQGEKAARLARADLKAAANQRAEEDEFSYQNDEDLAKQLDQEAKDREKLWAAQEKLREVNRHGMTPGAARADRAREIAELNDRIKYYEDETGLLSPADLDKLTGLKTRRAQLFNEQRQAPPSFTADHLARVGLYTSSTIGFNPVLNIQREQLKKLNDIEAAILGRPDPHAP